MRILGLTHPIGMDSAACLINDGEIIGLYEEERFCRQKHAPHLVPNNAITHLLREASLTIDQIDCMVVGFKRPAKQLTKNFTRELRAFFGDIHKAYDYHQDRLGQYKKIINVDHYLSHAHSVAPYFTDCDANLLVMDGWGGDAAGAMYYKDINGVIRELWRIPIEYSIGLFFQAITSFLGFQPHSDEGKTMGLAAYGTIDTTILPDYCDTSTLLPDLEKYIKYLSKLDCRRRPNQPIDDKHRIIAATAQHYLERSVLRIAELVHKETKCKNFGLAGGVALNCVANGKLANKSFVDKLIIQPAANDAGVSLGAALCKYNEIAGQCLTLSNNHALYGPTHDLDSINLALNLAQLKLSQKSTIDNAVKYLLEGKVIALYETKSEVGPRALGARSIIADPRNPAIKDVINSRVKRRELWRPFAPVVLEDYAKIIFGYSSPFMTISDTVKEEWRIKLPATTHIDGSARAQVIADKSSGLLARILRRFHECTGLPVLLNTSFNMYDEPMVLRPDHAIATFYRSGLDALVFEHGILSR